MRAQISGQAPRSEYDAQSAVERREANMTRSLRLSAAKRI